LEIFELVTLSCQAEPVEVLSKYRNHVLIVGFISFIASSRLVC